MPQFELRFVFLPQFFSICKDATSPAVFLLPPILFLISLSNLQYNRQPYQAVENVFEAADTRQKQAKKRSLCVINEHFEPVFNTVAATQIVFQRTVKGRGYDF